MAEAIENPRRSSIWLGLWIFVRVSLSMLLISAGWVIILAWLFGTSEIFGIDGSAMVTWRAELVFTLMFWPVEGPIWLGVLLLAFCGPIAVLFGSGLLVWCLRIISLPLGALAVWALKTGTVSGDKPHWFAVLILVAAAWIAPIRRRKSSSPTECAATDGGVGSS